ncbi:MAG: hypothetical protein RL011_2337 [Pseudomonadota bacterium]|jgi:serine phosphatase RsbU (regulator of sigma subunit)
MRTAQKISQWVKRLSPTTVFMVVMWFFILIVGERVGLGDYLSHNIGSSVNFYVRRAIKGDVPIDPRLKILAVDDTTVAMRGDARISPSGLAQLLRALDKRKPAKIIIDAMFSQRQEVLGGDVSEVAGIQNLTTPIVVGAMVSPQAIAFRTDISENKFISAWSRVGALPSNLKRIDNAKIYGPEGAYLQAFSRLGHFQEFAQNYFAPAIVVNNFMPIPHLSLYAADDLKIDRGTLLVNGTKVSIDERGLVPIDYLSASSLGKSIFSLSEFFSGQPWALDNIRPGDVVLIFTQYATGVTQFSNSPFGLVPGSWLFASNVNSVLRGVWLRSAGYTTWWLVGLTLIGVVIGMGLPLNRFFKRFALIFTVLMTSFIGAFVAFGIEIPWALPMLGFIGSVILGYSEQRNLETRRRIYLESERQTASVLQQDFLPPVSVTHEKYEIAAGYMAAEAVGGDWYSHGLIANRWLYLHLGDVTGHGVSSALLASFAKGATDMIHEEHCRDHGQPAPLATVHNCLNKIIRTSSADKLYMTMISMIIDLEEQTYSYMNSGHVPAVLIQEKGITILSQYANTLLGHSDEPQLAELVTRPLDTIHTILLFSDGLLDATSPKGRTPSLRMLTKLIKSSEVPSASDLRNLLELRCKVQLKADGIDALRDDVSFVIVRINANQPKQNLNPEIKNDAA